MIAILAHARQVEWTARLDFLWQLQASQEKKEMAVLQQSNKRILYNLLPAHVAAHFLDDQFRNNMVSDMGVKGKWEIGSGLHIGFIIELLYKIF